MSEIAKKQKICFTIYLKTLSLRPVKNPNAEVA